MLNWFKKSSGKSKKTVLTDLHDNPLTAGDRVIAYRYDLGEAICLEEEGHFFYQSEATGKKVSYTLMVDAITEKQKVKKIE